MRSKLKILLTVGLAILLLGTTLMLGEVAVADGAVADSSVQAAQIFEVHCAGCHVKGGNIVRRGKTLKLKALEKNQVDSLEAIAQLVTNGKGIMSAYDERLTADEIQAVSAYVLAQAKAGWVSR
jgi:cytochrome c6